MRNSDTWSGWFWCASIIQSLKTCTIYLCYHYNCFIYEFCVR